MSLLAQLEKVTEAERDALLSRDWAALRRCIEEKQRLTDELEKNPNVPEHFQFVRRLRQATRHNAELARRLSSHLVEAAGSAQVTHAPYGKRAQPMRSQGALLHVTG